MNKEAVTIKIVFDKATSTFAIHAQITKMSCEVLVGFEKKTP